MHPANQVIYLVILLFDLLIGVLRPSQEYFILTWAPSIMVDWKPEGLQGKPTATKTPKGKSWVELFNGNHQT